MKLVAILAAMFIRLLRLSVRARHVRAANIEKTPQYILAFWHSHLLLMLYAAYRRPIMVMISQSKDGELIAGTFQYFDVEAARGSSTRGGTQAMRDMLRSAAKGYNIVFTPDGPKGPPRVLKDGVIYAAQATGLPIIPVAFAAKKKSCCARGTGWSCRTPSHGRSSSTASRSSCRVTATSRSGAIAWRRS